MVEFNGDLKTEYRLFDIPVHALDMQQVLQEIDRRIRGSESGYLVTADASTFVTATQDRELFKILQDAIVVTADGMGVIWGISKLYQADIQKVSGVDLVEQLCKLSAEKGYKIFFLGAAPGVAEIAARKLTEKYPGCQIIGAMHGFFKEQEEEVIAKKIADLEPDILLVALGMPRQEKFLSKYLATTKAIIGIGVGGSFDVFSEKTKRAPKWFQKNRLEWLWRFALNPTKINKVKLLPQFVRMVKKEYGKNLYKNGR